MSRDRVGWYILILIDNTSRYVSKSTSMYKENKDK